MQAGSLILVGLGQAWALPIYSAFTTGVNGGSFSDILISAASSFAYAEALDFIGVQVKAGQMGTDTAILLHGVVGGA